MYYDEKPCEVCGSKVRLRARDDVRDSVAGAPGPVGPDDGVVGGADGPVDARVCLNPACPTNAG